MSDGENKKIDLFIILYSLNIGGAEKIAASLMDLREFNVWHVLFINEIRNYVFDDYKPIVLNKKNYKLKFFFLIYIFKLYLLKKKYKKAIFLSFLTLPNIMNIITGGKVIISERSLLSFYSRYYKKKLSIRFFDILAKLTYKKAGRIIAVSEDCKKDLIENYQATEKKIIVLPNFIDFEKSQRLIKETLTLSEYFLKNANDKIILCCVSRLSDYKGVYDLIYFFSKISSIYEDIILIVVGDGEDKDRILKLCEQEKINYAIGMEGLGNKNAKLFLVGAQTNPFPYLKIADLFVLNSFVEGFPNVVLEAMFAGCRIMVSRGSDVVEKLKENNPYFEVLPIFKMPDENYEIWHKTFKKVYMSIKTEGKKRIEYHNLQNYEKSKVLEQWNRFLLEQAR